MTPLEARKETNARAATHAHLDVLMNPKLDYGAQYRMYVALDQARANQRGDS